MERQTGLTTHVGGETAGNVDFASLTAERLPLLLVGVLTLSFLLLLVGFRSIAVAAQAILLNLLSVGAAYGIVVAVFQWGWGAGLTGATTAPVAPWIPTMLFAITFGLSMDYEVFVIGAIRDARAGHGDDRQAVVDGLASTAGVISGRRPDHGAGVRQLRDLQQPGSEGHRSRVGGRHRGGRFAHPPADRPGPHDHPGAGGVVVPALAGPLPATGRQPARLTAPPPRSRVRASEPALTLPGAAEDGMMGGLA